MSLNEREVARSVVSAQLDNYNCNEALDRLESGVANLFDAVDVLQMKLKLLLVEPDFPTTTNAENSNGKSALSGSLLGKAKALEELNRRIHHLTNNIDY